MLICVCRIIQNKFRKWRVGRNDGDLASLIERHVRIIVLILSEVNYNQHRLTGCIMFAKLISVRSIVLPVT